MYIYIYLYANTFVYKPFIYRNHFFHQGKDRKSCGSWKKLCTARALFRKISVSALETWWWKLTMAALKCLLKATKESLLGSAKPTLFPISTATKVFPSLSPSTNEHALTVELRSKMLQTNGKLRKSRAESAPAASGFFSPYSRTRLTHWISASLTCLRIYTYVLPVCVFCHSRPSICLPGKSGKHWPGPSVSWPKQHRMFDIFELAKYHRNFQIYFQFRSGNAGKYHDIYIYIYMHEFFHLDFFQQMYMVG